MSEVQILRKQMREAQSEFASCNCPKGPDCRKYKAFCDAFDRLVESDPRLGWDIKAAYKQRLGRVA